MNPKQFTPKRKPPDAVTKTSIMHEKEDALEALLRQLAGCIESVGGDDESKILCAGISIRTTTPTTQSPASPLALSATEADHEREIDLSWDSVKGVKSYVIERGADPPFNPLKRVFFSAISNA